MKPEYLRWPSGVHSPNSICTTISGLTQTQFSFPLVSKPRRLFWWQWSPVQHILRRHLLSTCRTVHSSKKICLDCSNYLACSVKPWNERIDSLSAYVLNICPARGIMAWGNALFHRGLCHLCCHCRRVKVSLWTSRTTYARWTPSRAWLATVQLTSRNNMATANCDSKYYSHL